MSDVNHLYLVVSLTCLTAWTVRRSTAHQGDFSDWVSVHLRPSWTVVTVPSTALAAGPPVASLLELAGLYLYKEDVYITI